MSLTTCLPPTVNFLWTGSTARLGDIPVCWSLSPGFGALVFLLTLEVWNARNCHCTFESFKDRVNSHVKKLILIKCWVGLCKYILYSLSYCDTPEEGVILFEILQVLLNILYLSWSFNMVFWATEPQGHYRYGGFFTVDFQCPAIIVDKIHFHAKGEFTDWCIEDFHYTRDNKSLVAMVHSICDPDHSVRWAVNTLLDSNFWTTDTLRGSFDIWIFQQCRTKYRQSSPLGSPQAISVISPLSAFF